PTRGRECASHASRCGRDWRTARTWPNCYAFMVNAAIVVRGRADFSGACDRRPDYDRRTPGGGGMRRVPSLLTLAFVIAVGVARSAGAAGTFTVTNSNNAGAGSLR